MQISPHDLYKIWRVNFAKKNIILFLDCQALGLIVSLELISFIEVKSFKAFELVLTHTNTFYQITRANTEAQSTD